MSIINTRYGEFNILDTDSVISPSLRLYGEWAQHEIDLLAKFIKPDAVVIDAGAFIGTHSRAFSAFVGKSGQVLAFEPRQITSTVLLKNAKLAPIDNITVIQSGLGATPEEIIISRQLIESDGNFGALSLEPLKNKKATGEKITITTIDSYALERLDFIKIDVEGMELTVLNGAKDTVARCNPVIFAECNSLEASVPIIDWCKQANYYLYGLLSPAYNENNYMGNAANIFGNGQEAGLLLIPENLHTSYKKVLRKQPLCTIKTADDLALLLLHKPQYPDEVLAHSAAVHNLSLNYTSPLADTLKQTITMYDEQITTLNRILAEREQQIAERDNQIIALCQAEASRDEQISHLIRIVVERDNQIKELHQHNDKYREHIELIETSLSWRITRPVRQIFSDEFPFGAVIRRSIKWVWWTITLQLPTKLSELRLARTHTEEELEYWRMVHVRSALQNIGFVQFCQELEKHIAKQKSLINFDEAAYLAANIDVAEEVAKGKILCGYIHYCLAGQYEKRPQHIYQADDVSTQNAMPLHFLHVQFEKPPPLKPTIIFDHNGGGGSNAYTEELVKIIHADHGTVIRVYCFAGIWFVQWRVADEDEQLFSCSSMEELFEVLLLSQSKNIIINSLYGYPDVSVAIRNILALINTSNARLDVKVHDFYALCTSPHLSDFEGKYCGVPKGVEYCKLCLEKNLSWYHNWYPKENRPTDIHEWRKPFAELFTVATTITFFDSSSVDIMRKEFSLTDEKVQVVPHTINYLTCDKPINTTGALHIGVLGTLSHIKGGHVVNALANYLSEQHLAIPITVIGSSYMATANNITVHGSYVASELAKIVEQYGINVILMPSIVPETFSYTISEAMAMGLPIVTFDLGAQGHRVKDYALGKVVPLGSSSTDLLTAIQAALKLAQE